jgi:D-threonate/D-erythronate kinase
MHLRLIADDLTGALDTAAQFVARTGPVPVFWSRLAAAVLPSSAAIDGGTRESGPDASAAIAAEVAHALDVSSDTFAFWKLDSLLRGHWGLALAACLRTLRPTHCIIAPAFPFQGRVTRGGRQYTSAANGWQPVGEALDIVLARHGVATALARPGDAVPSGVSVWDADTNADLASVAAAGLAVDGRVLWCGSSGLAGALAGQRPPAPTDLAPPVLGLFGSDHPVTAAQLRAVAPHHLTLPDGSVASAAIVAARLEAAGTALVAFELPSDLPRATAAARIAREMAALTERLAPPRTLVVAGGETLRALCIALGTERLDVCGQLLPGVPRSVMRGGRWDGVDVVSKSGAFGTPDLLRQLVAGELEGTGT